MSNRKKRNLQKSVVSDVDTNEKDVSSASLSRDRKNEELENKLKSSHHSEDEATAPISLFIVPLVKESVQPDENVNKKISDDKIAATTAEEETHLRRSQRQRKQVDRLIFGINDQQLKRKHEKILTSKSFDNKTSLSSSSLAAAIASSTAILPKKSRVMGEDITKPKKKIKDDFPSTSSSSSSSAIASMLQFQPSSFASPLNHKYEYNADNLRKMLEEHLVDEARAQPQQDIEVLSLDHLSKDDWFKRLNEFLPILDKKFEEGKLMTNFKDYPKRHDLLLLALIRESDQYPLLVHLRDHYVKNLIMSNDGDIVINILLPEWILAMFMKEHNFTERSEAMSRIIRQDKIISERPENVSKFVDEIISDLTWFNKEVKKKSF